MAGSADVFAVTHQAVRSEELVGHVDILLTDVACAARANADVRKHVAAAEYTHVIFLDPCAVGAHGFEQELHGFVTIAAIQLLARHATGRQHVVTHTPKSVARMPENQGYAGAEQGANPRADTCEMQIAGL